MVILGQILDLIYRQAAIDFVGSMEMCDEISAEAYKKLTNYLEDLPSVEPTLYGYKIEHLAYIARVMEKEGITPEDAARAFSDIGYAVSMIRDEIGQKMEEAIYDHNTGKI